MNTWERIQIWILSNLVYEDGDAEIWHPDFWNKKSTIINIVDIYPNHFYFSSAFALVHTVSSSYIAISFTVCTSKCVSEN